MDNFIYIMEQIKVLSDEQNALESELKKFYPEMGILLVNQKAIDILINLAKKISKEDDLIDYFIYELEFGKEYKPGMILDENDNEINLSSIEDLYNFLGGENE